jgi:RHS repeat-associated protein
VRRVRAGLSDSGVSVDAGVEWTTTYEYNDLNQLTYDTANSFWYYYDGNGNLRERGNDIGKYNLLWYYDWSEDDRLTRVRYLEVDDEVETNRRTTFAYDAMGRRLLRQDDDGTWTRYFYDGLNVLLEREGTTSPSGWDSYVCDDLEDGNTSEWYSYNGTTLSNTWRAQRRSRVLTTSCPTMDWTRALTRRSSIHSNPNDGEFDQPRRAITWAAQRAESGEVNYIVDVKADCDGTEREVQVVYTNAGTSRYASANNSIWFGLGAPLGSGSSSGWQVISRDVAADVASVLTTYTVEEIDCFFVHKNDSRVDDIRLADAVTTRIYTLLPSALGGIISIREVNPTGPNTDTWYAYDRLGSVCLTTDAAGASNGLRWQDAYGNQLASVDTGAWTSASASEGYGLTTKWFDGDVELYSFAQRWNDPTCGRFLSSTPLPPHREHPYNYTSSNPVRFADPTGRDQINGCDGPVHALIDSALAAIVWGMADQWMCNGCQPEKQKCNEVCSCIMNRLWTGNLTIDCSTRIHTDTGFASGAGVIFINPEEVHEFTTLSFENGIMHELAHVCGASSDGLLKPGGDCDNAVTYDHDWTFPAGGGVR